MTDPAGVSKLPVGLDAGSVLNAQLDTNSRR
jgi:hypothetical protein